MTPEREPTLRADDGEVSEVSEVPWDAPPILIENCAIDRYDFHIDYRRIGDPGRRRKGDQPPRKRVADSRPAGRRQWGGEKGTREPSMPAAPSSPRPHASARISRATPTAVAVAVHASAMSPAATTPSREAPPATQI